MKIWRLLVLLNAAADQLVLRDNQRCDS